MKKISCNVISDLLPLYIDDVVSDDTKVIVEDHFKECRSCMEKADKMRNTIIISNDKDGEKIKKLKKKMSVKKIATVCVSSLLTLVILFGMGFYLFFYGNAVSSDDVIVKRGFVKDNNNSSYLNQEWIIDFSLKSGKALNTIRKDVYSNDADGNKVRVGTSVELREVPIGILFAGSDSDFKINEFTYGFGYGTDKSVYTPDVPYEETNNFQDEIIIVIYKNMRVTYSMQNEGIFEEQSTVDNIEDLPVVNDLPHEGTTR